MARPVNGDRARDARRHSPRLLRWLDERESAQEAAAMRRAGSRWHEGASEQEPDPASTREEAQREAGGLGHRSLEGVVPCRAGTHRAMRVERHERVAALLGGALLHDELALARRLGPVDVARVV